MSMAEKQTVTRQNIVTALKKLGLKQNDIVLVHGSLSRIGLVDGGADAVIDALLEVVGGNGTLLMPSFQSGSEFFLAQSKCVFDIRNSPSELGIISETFRKRPGVIRSLSPTHCTAGIGPEHGPFLKTMNSAGYQPGMVPRITNWFRHAAKYFCWALITAQIPPCILWRTPTARRHCAASYSSLR